MDVKHCLIVQEIGICEIQCVADKTSVQRLSIMFTKRVFSVWQGKETKKYWNDEGKMEIISCAHPPAGRGNVILLVGRSCKPARSS